ncbi:MAG: UDP-N-acetylmuramate dehydrogenase [Verrucomicrobia bacterium]|nr:UDP-N-acetylmuramate dehydrogenase [Verrucomicrobiota bacterium]
MNLKFQQGRWLKEFSTFGIGGPVRLFAEIGSIEEMEEALRYARKEKIPFLVLGKGSNCLFSDRGFDGLALLNKIEFIRWKEWEVEVGSGYSFSLLGVQTARKGLSGLEFASGIPATVGGALFMNAGANGKETCETVQSVLFLTEEGEKKIFLRQDLEFSYRTSPFQRMRGAILSATFTLTPSTEARPSQLKIVDYRMKTQPYKDKSAGCVFRNPKPDLPAGALIDRCGLKGLQVGGAKVSEMHANFIVNAGKATSEDVLELIKKIQSRVAEQTGIHLEAEIRMLNDG